MQFESEYNGYLYIIYFVIPKIEIIGSLCCGRGEEIMEFEIINF